MEAAEEAEKLAAAAAAGDEAAKKAAAEEEEAEGPVIVEEEYRDVVMAGPQGGFFSRQVQLKWRLFCIFIFIISQMFIFLFFYHRIAYDISTVTRAGT